MTPALEKLKLSGLIDSEGYVVNHKWIDLFQSCCSLAAVNVDVSLKSDKHCFSNEMIQISLREINLDLRSTDDDEDYYLSEINQNRCWKLSGIIMRHHIPTYHITKKVTQRKK
jgi:hypothetical protein